MKMRYDLAVGGCAVLLLVATPAAAQRAKAAMDPAPIGDPGAWVKVEDYPREAKRYNRQGRVVAALDISATGAVTACRIKTSSGTESLDAKTCQVLLERGRFNPATDKRGRPTTGVIILPVRWELDDSPPDDARLEALDVAAARAEVEAEIAVGIDGKITSCRMITQIAPASARGADQCAGMKPGTVWGTSFTKDGKPTAVVIRQRFTRSVSSTSP